jgi:hypothetical protein
MGAVTTNNEDVHTRLRFLQNGKQQLRSEQLVGTLQVVKPLSSSVFLFLFIFISSVSAIFNISASSVKMF